MSNLSNKDYTKLAELDVFTVTLPPQTFPDTAAIPGWFYAPESVPFIGEVYQPLPIRTASGNIARRNWCTDRKCVIFFICQACSLNVMGHNASTAWRWWMDRSFISWLGTLRHCESLREVIFPHLVAFLRWVSTFYPDTNAAWDVF